MRPFAAFLALLAALCLAPTHAQEPVPLPTLDPGEYPPGTPEAPVPVPSPSPTPQPGPIQSIIRYFFQIWFPANTFQEAVEGAARAIFNAEVEALTQPMTEVLNTVMFAGESVSGNVPLPGQFAAVTDVLTKAAVPLWGLGLALLALAVLTRQATGLGYGTNEVAFEAARWFFVALASGNAYTIVRGVHDGVGALTYAIGSGSGANAGAMIAAFLFGGSAPDLSIVILIMIVLVGIVTILVLSVTYIARYAAIVGVAALAPLAIACEGIPFTRFVFRDWLGMFLKLELLQILNIVVLRVFADLGMSGWGQGLEGAGGYIVKLVVMVGLASAIIGLNTMIFRQVFGTAIDVAREMRGAVEQLVGSVAAVLGVAATAATGVPIPASAVAGAGASTSTTGSGTGYDPLHTRYRLGAPGGDSPGRESAAPSPSSSSEDGAKPTDAASDRGESEAAQRGDATKSTDAEPDKPQGDTAGSKGAQPERAADEPNRDDKASPQRVAGELGAVARAVSRASRAGGVMGAALRGFGEGTAAGERLAAGREAAPASEARPGRAAERVEARVQQAEARRAERQAFHMGADNPIEARQIAESMLPADDGLAPSGYTPAQMREAHSLNQPLLRDMARTLGGPARAAAQGGYGSFAQMANAMAVERLRGAGVVSAVERPAPPAPITTWVNTPPDESRATQFTPHDYGLGALVAGNLRSQPSAYPDWARTMHSLRQAYPADTATPYGQFIERVQRGAFADERQARTWLDDAIRADPPLAGEVKVWWR